MPDLDPLEFLIGELNSGNPQQCVQCITRLRVIGLALGQEKTKAELLPYLTQEIEQGKFPDEVLVSIAEVLGSYTDFVSEAHCLLVPLDRLCSVEESTVRDQAVQSILLIGKVLPAAQLYEHLVPIAMKLGKQTDWFTPRVSACGLLALAYSSTAEVLRAGGSPEVADRAAELRDLFCKHLGVDESPMVRRAAATRLSDFAKALGSQYTESDLLPLYRHLLCDEQESVRVNALGCVATICSLLGETERHEVLNKHFREAVHDKSWRVRVTCAENFSEVAEVCHTDPTLLLILKELYVKLQEDHESEVRIEAAGRAAGVAKSLGVDFGSTVIFPVVSKLVQDQNCGSRRQLASVLMQLAEPLRKPNTLELIHPIVCLMIEDDDTNVRLAAINHFSKYIDVCGLDDEGGGKWGDSPSLLEIIGKLNDDKNWRVRLAILELLPKLHQIAAAETDKLFSLAAMEKKAADGVALVRLTWVDMITRVAESYSSDSDKHKWLDEYVVPVFDGQAEPSKNYQLQVVIMYGIGKLAPHLKQNVLEMQLLPKALDIAATKVPNLRIAVVQALELATPHVSSGYRSAKLQCKLQDFLQDADVDVKAAAELAMTNLESKGLF